MDHDEAQELLGAYALDAVDEDEVEAVREHLSDCPRCRDELAAHRLAAAALGPAGGEAPPEIWDRIAGRLTDSPPPLRLVRRPAAHRARWASWAVRVGAAAAAVAIAFLGWDVSHLDAKLGRLQVAVSRSGIAQAASAAAFASGSRRVELRSSTSNLRAVVVIRPDGQAFLVTATLPPLRTGDTYQLWGLSGDRLISLGLLGRVPAPSAFRVGAATRALMITAEPSGGVSAPTTPVLVRGALSST
jgi:anti-sigma-K factor RskA